MASEPKKYKITLWEIDEDGKETHSIYESSEVRSYEVTSRTHSHGAGVRVHVAILEQPFLDPVANNEVKDDGDK